MTHMFIDHLENAYQALRHNRGRTLLTIVGITIGIASVTCILAISGGVSKVIGAQVESYNGKLAVIRPGLQTRDPNALINPIVQQSFSTSTLTDSDVEALAHIPHISAVVPLMTLNATLSVDTTRAKDNVVLATVPAFADVADVTMKFGQFLDTTTNSNTAVVGEQLAIDLFGTDKPIGELFTLRGQQFTVIGVIKNTTNTVNYNNIDLNHAAIINFARGATLNQGRSQIQQIDILTDSATSTAGVTSKIRQTLIANHQGEEDFSITTGSDISRPTNQLFVALTGVMTAIATISLVVGGVGIMNIMLVGVAERTREIGIRKAVGASQGMIITQFLIESLMMSLVGGIIGYLLGYVFAYVVSVFLYFNPAFSWYTLGAAVTMSVSTGVIFGIYPAIKAARKDTIESLRQYH